MVSPFGELLQPARSSRGRQRIIPGNKGGGWVNANGIGSPSAQGGGGGPTDTCAAIDFTGAGYVDFGHEPTAQTGSFTAACWFKADGTQGATGYGSLFARANNGVGGHNNWVTFLRTDGELAFFVYHHPSGVSSIDGVGSVYDDGEWHSVVFVFSGDENGMKIYVDNILDAQTTPSNGTVFQGVGGPDKLIFGQHSLNVPGDYYYHGSSRTFQLSNEAWDTTKVAAWHNSGCPVMEDVGGNVVLFCKGNDNTGTTVTDSSGNGFDGEFVDTVAWEEDCPCP